jgi:hypothetical protein
LRRVDTWMSPCPAHYPDADVQTNAARVPFTQPPFCCCAMRARLLYCCTKPSPPFLSHGAARIASTQCMAIKGGHPLRLIRTSAVSASGKLSPPHSPLFSATSSVPSHLTPPLSPYAGPRASPEPRAAPQPKEPAPSPPLSSSTIDRADELRLSVVRPPRFDSVPGTMSGRCTEVHGCFLWTSSHRSSSHRPSLAVPHRAPTPRTARRVDLDVVYLWPPLRATPCHAAPHRLGRQLCGAWTSGSYRCGLRQLGRFGTVAGPWQAKRALCTQAELGFSLEAV